MDAGTITSLITTLGFPIVCVLGLGWFIYKIYTDQQKSSEANMEKVQARCKEREEKLYKEIAENRAVNAKAIETIAHYVEKLDVIQNDIHEIKTDITVIKTRASQ